MLGRQFFFKNATELGAGWDVACIDFMTLSRTEAFLHKRLRSTAELTMRRNRIGGITKLLNRNICM